MTAPVRSRLARTADLLFVLPPAPFARPRWLWLLWPFAVLLGVPGWPQTGGVVRRGSVFFLRLFQGPAVRLLVLTTIALLWIRYLLNGSLPPVDGTRPQEGIAATVTVERDFLGVPTVTATNRTDLAFGLGFVHGQDRFFQMDLSRRFAAGELSALLGKATVETDKGSRLHRFRHRARQRLQVLPEEDRVLLDAYARGVNAGRNSLRSKPWEYHVLRADPDPWTAEDSVLIVYTMYLMLQSHTPVLEASQETVEQTLPPALAALFFNQGDEWDAPLVGPAFAVPPLPGPDDFDLRREGDALKKAPADPAWRRLLEKQSPGSNNWAVSGKHTKHGGALVANDMHLSITVPVIWYRAALVWQDERGETCTAWGATLPGGPGVIVGSNGHIAWGLTNSEGDWADLVLLDPDPANNQQYLSPMGPLPYSVAVETITVKGSAPVEHCVRETIWGPLLEEHDNDRARPRALRWVAHDPESTTLDFTHMMEVRDVNGALALAQRSGTPHCNFVVGDRTGNIGWTTVGRLPRRTGFDGTVPVSWADGGCAWRGYYEPSECPRLENPPSGRLWTANNRVVEGEGLRQIGLTGYDRGARAGQIRDALLAVESPTEADMLAIQRDNRALFLDRWHQLLLKVLNSEKAGGDSRFDRLRADVTNWGARATKESVGFRSVVEFRARVQRAVLVPLTARCRVADDRFTIGQFRNLEGPVWRIVQERPVHLLDPRFRDWDALLHDVIERMLTHSDPDDDQTWGHWNTAVHRHALSPGLAGVPYVGKWLVQQIDRPAIPLDGGWGDMPFVQGPVHGASQRMGVSPGREAEGYFHMPGGQSGHFLSPHYGDGYDAWLKGERTPLLPGPTVSRLVLQPQ